MTSMTASSGRRAGHRPGPQTHAARGRDWMAEMLGEHALVRARAGWESGRRSSLVAESTQRARGEMRWGAGVSPVS